jgi:hypothetical protein
MIMQNASSANERFVSLVCTLRSSVMKAIFGKSWACARYQRRHAPLAGPRPGARLD